MNKLIKTDLKNMADIVKITTSYKPTERSKAPPHTPPKAVMEQRYRYNAKTKKIDILPAENE